MTNSVESAEDFSVPHVPVPPEIETDTTFFSDLRRNVHCIVATLALLATPLDPLAPTASAQPLRASGSAAVAGPVAGKPLAENKERKKLTAKEKEELVQIIGAEFLQKYPQYRSYSIGQIDGGKTLVVTFISGSGKLNAPDTRVAVVLHKLNPKGDETPTRYFLEGTYQSGQSTVVHQIVIVGKDADGKSWQLYLPMDSTSSKTQISTITTTVSSCQNPPCFKGSAITDLTDDK